MRSQFDSRDTRSTARFQRANRLCLFVRWRALGLAAAAILCGTVASPPRAIAQEPGTQPEINAPVPNSDPTEDRPVNNTSAKPSNQQRGMPPNVVRPLPEPATTTPAAHAPAPSSTASPTSGAAATTPAPPVESTSLLQQPAHRAQVHVGDSGLTVQADNSNLSQVLRDISSATGMKVEGIGHDERIFGNYGPGAPRDVLTSLLYGAGYNVLMIGEIADGAPRQLILSQRKGGSTPGAAAATTSTEEDDTEPDPGEGQDIEAAPVPTQAVPILQKPDATPGSEVRTPQQLLEQLQRMHQDQPQLPPQTLQPQQD
jgi:hypothetical protein